jgi:hypothetical protein
MKHWKFAVGVALFCLILGFWLKPGDQAASTSANGDGQAGRSTAGSAAADTSSSSSTSSSASGKPERGVSSNIPTKPTFQASDVAVRDYIPNPLEINDIYPGAELLSGKEFNRVSPRGVPEVWKVARLKTNHRFGQLRYREIYDAADPTRRLRRELVAAQYIMIGVKFGIEPSVLESKLFGLGYRVSKKNEDHTRWTLEFDSDELLDVDKKIETLRGHEGVAWVEPIRLHKAF